MPKKFTILSALAAIGLSTFAPLAPVFAEVEEHYHTPELAELHAKYAADMAVCGEYVYNNTYLTCYNTITNNYREQYGGLFESMYQLDFNGRMIVTGFNPAAHSLRFYIDETSAFRSQPFEFENLVIYWADDNADGGPNWNSNTQWNFVDNYLATGEIPTGFHVLYGGKKGEKGWFNVNSENYVNYGDDTTAEGFLYDSESYIILNGYDTSGNRHTERNYLSSCTNHNLLKGNECLLEYTYENQIASPKYVIAEPSGIDATVVALDRAIKAKEEAEARLAEVESRLTEAENRAAAAETAYDQILEQLWAMESSVMYYQMMLEEAEANLARVNQALAESDQALEETSRALDEANQALEETSRALDEANQAAISARAEAASLAAQLEEANLELSSAKDAVSKAEQEVREARASEEAAKKAKDQMNESVPTTVTIYRTIEKVVENNSATSEPTAEKTDVTEKTEKSTENYVELPTSGENEEYNFPWWIIVFVFTGIALTLWWFVPSKRRS